MKELDRRKLMIAALLLFISTTTAAHSQTFATLYNFNLENGAGPSQASLVQGEDGSFYGTTSGGGTNSDGTVFRITTQGVLTTLYNFCTLANCADGELPNAALTLATDGNFYGTALSGGVNGWGSIFKITPNGNLTTLHSFCAKPICLDGATPSSGLVQATDGNLYGTAEQGGVGGHGVVFRITTGGKFAIIYNFCKLTSCHDGYSPRGNLIQATDNNLYGTTASGGDRGQGGTVFRIKKGGAFISVALHSGGGGGGPMAGLAQGSDGSFYGPQFMAVSQEKARYLKLRRQGCRRPYTDSALMATVMTASSPLLG